MASFTTSYRPRSKSYRAQLGPVLACCLGRLIEFPRVKIVITEEMVLAFPEKLHNGIIVPDIDIGNYRSYFGRVGCCS